MTSPYVSCAAGLRKAVKTLVVINALIWASTGLAYASSSPESITGEMVFSTHESGGWGQVAGRANESVGREGDYIRFRMGSPTFRIRYAIWTLLGESLWSFETRYELPRELWIYRDGKRAMVIRQASGATGIRAGESTAGQYMAVTVPSEVMNLARVTFFNFSASVSGGGAAIFKRNPGVTGPSGEWGWDVPANPTWDRMFVRPHVLRAQKDPRELSSDAWVDEDAAKNVFRELQQGRRLVPRGISEIRMDIQPLLFAIREETPEAFEYYYTRPRDEQAMAMVSAISRAQENGQTGVASRAQTIARTLESYGDQVSPDLVNYARQLQHHAQRESIKRQIRDLGRMSKETLETAKPNDEHEWPARFKHRLTLIESLLRDRDIPADDPIRRQADHLYDTLHIASGRGRYLYVYASARTSLPSQFHEAVYLSTGRLSDERRRQIREQRAEERRIAARKRDIDRGALPTPVHTRTFRVRVPEDITDQEAREKLRAWAESELEATQRLKRPLRHHSEDRLQRGIHVFVADSKVQAIEAREERERYRRRSSTELAVNPPSNRIFNQ